MTSKLRITPPTLGPKGPAMKGAPGHWYFRAEPFSEKAIVESWEVANGKRRHRWRVMRDSTCLASEDMEQGLGEQAAANSAAKWLASRARFYERLGVK